MSYIIIGAGPAGIVAAETLRQNDPESAITIISSEQEPPYSRMAIPYLLIGNIEEEGCYLKSDSDFYQKHNIRLLQQSVTKIDTEKQSVALADGNAISYKKLLIASGSRPISPPIPGTNLDFVHSCWTMQDARQIIERASEGSNVVLIGAGFIGCIILEALVKRGVNLTVVETGNRMVPRMLDDKAGNLLKRWCENKGVTVKTSAKVESITQQNGSGKVQIDSGESFDADLVITATGVTPNIEFVDGSGIKTDQGIMVNNQLQTNIEDVFAAGDVAQGLDFSTGQHSVQAIQPTATDHGRIAALNMVGKTTTHHGSVNMNILDTLGLISCSFGLWMGVHGGDSVELYNEDSFQYLNLQFDGNHLVGASATGKTDHIGILRGLIESRIPLGVWKERLLDNPTCLMEAYMACTQELGYASH